MKILPCRRRALRLTLPGYNAENESNRQNSLEYSSPCTRHHRNTTSNTNTASSISARLRTRTGRAWNVCAALVRRLIVTFLLLFLPPSPKTTIEAYIHMIIRFEICLFPRRDKLKQTTFSTRVKNRETPPATKFCQLLSTITTCCSGTISEREDIPELPASSKRTGHSSIVVAQSRRHAGSFVRATVPLFCSLASCTNAYWLCHGTPVRQATQVPYALQQIRVSCLHAFWKKQDATRLEKTGVWGNLHREHDY